MPLLNEVLALSSTLANLSNHHLVVELKSWTARERQVTVGVLLLLNEVERRKLHLDRYSSLFKYCTDQLGLSNAAAWRRITAARCLREYPAVLPMLIDGRLNLTTLCIVARVLTEQNVADLLARASGASQEEVERLAAEFGAPKPARDRIKPVKPLRNPSAAGETGSKGRQPHETAADARSAENTGRAPGAGDGGAADHAATGSEDKVAGNSAAARLARDADRSEGETPMYDITFRAERRVVEKLRRAQSLLSFGHENPSLAVVVDRALEMLLDRHDPARREARRQGRETDRQAREAERLRRSFATKNTETATDQHRSGPEPSHESRARADRSEDFAAVAASAQHVHTALDRPIGASSGSSIGIHPSGMHGACHGGEVDGQQSGETSLPSKEEQVRALRRTVPRHVRDQVFLVYGMQCAYAGPDGRCPETRNLELDHIVPRAAGGSDHPTNLRPMCRAHNQRAADRVFGTDFMDRHRSGTSAPEVPRVARGGIACPSFRGQPSDR